MGMKEVVDYKHEAGGCSLWAELLISVATSQLTVS